MGQVTSNNEGFIIFGNTINSEKDNIRKKEFEVDNIDKLVYTNDVINKTFPMQLKVKTKDSTHYEDSELTLNLYYHFCENLHREVSKEWYQDFTQLDNYENDERIFFVKEGD